TFLPWIAFYAQYVDRGAGFRSFSGWDLITDCASRAFPGQCVFEEHTISPEFVPRRVVAGDAALVAGASLTIIGLMILTWRPRGRGLGALIALGGAVPLAARACGFVTIIAFVAATNGPDVASIEVGAALRRCAPP